MIENLSPGGGGGGLESVVAGTGISVDNTNPDNPIITNTSLNTDEVAKVSANDTTAGYLNGKLVAGSGIALTENNNGGNETLGIAVANIDASAITTGTIATARLGTGTASSSTYLRGDQTWAAISAGPTFYTVTANDVENTTSEVTALTWTVPANTWSNGQSIVLEWFVEASNGTGSSANFNYKFGGTGITELSATNGVINSLVGYKAFRQMRVFVVRDGNGVLYPAPFTSMSGSSWPSFSLNPLAGFPTQAMEFDNRFSVDSSVDFTTNITFTVKVSFSVAAATMYLRNRFATVYKIDGTP